MTQNENRILTTRAGFTPREEWGFRYKDGGGSFIAANEVDARYNVRRSPDVFALVYRVLEVPEWTEVSE